MLKICMKKFDAEKNNCSDKLRAFLICAIFRRWLIMHTLCNQDHLTLLMFCIHVTGLLNICE